jgi:FG-GAP repeat
MGIGMNTGGADNWGLVTNCIANDRDGWNDAFGDALALSGDTLIVGARRDTDTGGGGGANGSAYLCYRNQGGADNWGVVRKIRPAGNANNDYFGTSLALSGDTLAAGAPGRGGSVGAAYMFSRNSGGTNKEIAYAGSSSMPQFGRSVCLSNDTLAVGAPLDDLGTGWQGSVHMFYRDKGGTNQWGAAAKSVDPDGWAETTWAGESPWSWTPSSPEDTETLFGWGSICAFARNQGGLDNWGRTAKLVPADGVASGSFGQAIDFDGTMILTGAPGDTVGSNTGQGSVYAFKL